MNHCTKYFLRLILLSLVINFNSYAATLTDVTITPADFAAGANTTYTVRFTTVSPIPATGTYVIDLISDNVNSTISKCNPADVNNSLVGCTRYTAAATIAYSNVSEPASLQNSLVARSVLGRYETYFEVQNGGSAGAGVVVQFDIVDVANPADVGQGADFFLQVRDGNTVIDQGMFPGIVFTGAGGPIVSNNIPDKTIYADDGANAVDLDPAAPVNTDLNYTFSVDNDTLSFSVDSVADSTVVTASISGNELILTGLKTGSTDVTIRADDTSGNFVTDTFTVNSVGTLNSASITPASLLAGDTTNYTISFKPAEALSAGDEVLLTGGSVTDFVGASYVSITGGSLGVNAVTTVNAGQTLSIDLTGSAATTDTITIVIGNITNPGAAGMSANYTLETKPSGSSLNGRSTIAGNTFAASSAPTVSHLISSQNFNQGDSPYTVDVSASSNSNVVTDLNDVFVDGDGDALTFSIDSVGDTGIVTASINGSNEIILNGVSGGTTSVTVKATAVDGSVTTSFSVSVIATLNPASVTPGSLFTNAVTNYTLTFTPQESVSSGYVIEFKTGGGINQNSSALVSFSGGLTGMRTAGTPSITDITINSGSVNANTEITMVLSGIVNPLNAGMVPDYEIFVINAGNSIGQSLVAGDVFTPASDDIFKDGFEAAVVVVAAKNTVALINRMHIPNQAIAEFDTETLQYKFMNQSLSVKNKMRVRSMNEVLDWFKSVLYRNAPNGDFDRDGISNEFDSKPFGIVSNK